MPLTRPLVAPLTGITEGQLDSALAGVAAQISTAIDDYSVNDSLTFIVNGDDTVSGYAFTEIPEYHFSLFTYMKAAQISHRVTTIGSGGFYYCASLTSVTIPDSVTSIGEVAFGFCTALTSVTIPDSVTSIGNVAFSFCNSLTEANIYVTKTIIDASTNLFENSGLTTIYARASDATWTEGTGLTIGGKSGVEVIKNL